MNLDYTACGKVRIKILIYIEEIITSLDKAYSKRKGTESSTATNNISVANEDRKKLDQEKVVEFQNLVENNLYDTKRARTYTCTEIAFLKTRVRAPDEDEWA